MRLESLQFVEFEGLPREWRLERTDFGAITLLVGKNASGKSRTLNVVAALAGLLAGTVKPSFQSGLFEATLNDGSERYDILLKISEAKVVEERLSRNGVEMLNRAGGGAGSIYAEELHDKMRFQPPESQLAMVARRDAIQHPFLEPLHIWAKGFRHFQFGTPLGKDKMAIFVKGGANKIDPSQTDQVVGVFQLGYKIGGNEFSAAILKDMAQIGYDLEAVGIHAIPSSELEVNGVLPGEVHGIYVKEKSLQTTTEQPMMSQGMFRALSVIIQINFGIFSSSPTCILIDDIGEGLDFERSCALISVLMEKAESSNVQLIMSTNDRFIMNKVPLAFWSIIHREGHSCHLYNARNAKEAFEKFRFTGLNNFDFFATDFLNAQKVEPEKLSPKS